MRGKMSDAVHFQPADSGSPQTNALQLKVHPGDKKNFHNKRISHRGKEMEVNAVQCPG